MVHLNLELKLKGPLYSELKEMLALIDSLKEPDKLWSSKHTKGTVDLFTSAIILWLTDEAYRKFNLKAELNASYRSLSSLLKLKVSEVNKAGKISLEDLLEILQCSTTLLQHYDDKHLRKVLFNFLSNNIKYLVRLINSYNVYSTCLPSLITIITVNFLEELSKHDSKVTETIIHTFLEKISKERSTNANPLTFYWISEALMKLAKSRTISTYRNQTTSALKHIESIILRSTEAFDELEYIPLDYFLWYYHFLENVFALSSTLRTEVDISIKRIHNNIMKYILSTGKILWLRTSYGNVFHKIREHAIKPHIRAKIKPEKQDIDLITLSLFIGALIKAGRHTISYITDYDLMKVEGARFAALLISIALIVLGISILTGITIALSAVERLIYDRLFYASCIMILTGCYINYSTMRNKIHTYRDIYKVLLDVILHLRKIV